MSALLAAAVADNVAWCQRVCRAHGISTRTDAGVWSAGSPTPPFYPDATTVDPAATSAQVNNVLGGRRPASVKDSYAQLELGPFGFAPLFSATWIGLDPEVGHGNDATTWEAVSMPAALTQWSAAHGAIEVFRPTLLTDPAVSFLMLRDGAHVIAGAIAQHTGAVIGLSNLFGRDPAGDVWPRIVAELRARFPGAPIVGYERDDDLVAARAAGFSALGPLRVWARPEHR